MLTVNTKLDHLHTGVEIDDEVSLSFDLRQKSRLRARLQSGEEVAIFMPRGTILRGGDFMIAEDGSVIRVIAAAQQVMRVTAESHLDLMRAAYHLGNRHVPLELGEGYLKLESDYVLKEMLIGLGVAVEEVSQSFEPEAGAYGGGHHHSAEQHPHVYLQGHGHG